MHDPRTTNSDGIEKPFMQHRPQNPLEHATRSALMESIKEGLNLIAKDRPFGRLQQFHGWGERRSHPDTVS